jgi:hypothetical protein
MIVIIPFALSHVNSNICVAGKNYSRRIVTLTYSRLRWKTAKGGKLSVSSVVSMRIRILARVVHAKLQSR